ncbi:hypothetical protein [Faecalimonas sp.]
MKQSFKKFIIIFFSILLIIIVLCVAQFVYHSFKTPKIEKKSHTLYGFLLTDKNQEHLPVTATIDFEIGTYPFHNKETFIQGKITISYAQKEIYTTDFYSHNLKRKYISIEDTTSSPSTLVAFTGNLKNFLLGIPAKELHSIDTIGNSETVLFAFSEKSTKDFAKPFSVFPNNLEQVNEWLTKNKWK